MKIQTINPATGKVLDTYKALQKTDIDKIIKQTQGAFTDWSHTSFKTRSEKMRKVSELLLAHKQTYATLMAKEMGKPLKSGLVEIEKCAFVCNYYAENAEKLLEPEQVKTELSQSYVTFQPSGIIFAIMPWNFPFWQVFRFAAPNLMAGNACLLKHAPISTGTGLAIEELFLEAGFPKNIFKTLVIETSLAHFVITHPDVRGVTLTGSEKAGKEVASTAGNYLKPSVLELGGSDPYVVLEDADLELAAQVCVSSRLNNSGQVCIAAKRIIVIAEKATALEEKILTELKQYTVGNPLDLKTNLGPLARKDLRDTVHKQVTRSIKAGALLKIGGEIPPGPGFYYPPTLLTQVKPGQPAFDEEVFGPVICLIEASDEKDAIKLANQTPYGLGAAVFTKDIVRGQQIASQQLKAGTCALNTAVHSDPRLPFGGFKNSGYGRELGSYGLKAFLNIKTIQIK